MTLCACNFVIANHACHRYTRCLSAADAPVKFKGYDAYEIEQRRTILLKTFVSLANKLLQESGAGTTVSKSKRSAHGGRRRRPREDAAKVKQEMAAARARGVAVKKISARNTG